MAKGDIGLYSNQDRVVMKPKSARAKEHFKEKLGLPEDCDGLDITEIGPYEMMDNLPRFLILTEDKIVPKKTHKYLLP